MTRDGYPAFHTIPTRWMDNDAYGHVNNAIYYSWFDTAVNALLVDHGLLHVTASPIIGLVAESLCRYHRSIAFPAVVDAGVRIARLGNSSIRWEIGLFTAGETTAAAAGYLVHVYVDRTTRRPIKLPDSWRSGLAALDRVAQGL